jgi:hypothetical protein
LTGTRIGVVQSRAALIAVGFLASLDVLFAQQAMTMSVEKEVLRVKTSMFRFLDGEAMNRLRNGRSVRFDFELAVLSRSRGPVVTLERQSFNLSYDLWEERFAATRIGLPGRSASHLTQTQAETWCVDQLALAVSTFGHLGRDTPFWLRLAYTLVDRERSSGSDTAEGFTIWSLIDVLSRRRSVEALSGFVEAGPFRLSD